LLILTKLNRSISGLPVVLTLPLLLQARRIAANVAKLPELLR